MQPAHMGVAKRPPRRGMTKRYRAEVFGAFERWGWDENGWAKTTRYRYRRRAEAADRWLTDQGKVHLVWSSTADLRAYLFSTTPTPQNRNDIRSALVAFSKFCIAQGYREDNPAAPLPRLTVPRAQPHSLTIEEAQRVVKVTQHLGPMDRAMVLLYLYTGLRKSEGRLLEWRNVSPGWVRVLGKGSKERDVPLHPTADAALSAWHSTCTDARWVFPSPKFVGRAVSDTYIADTVAHVGRMAGLRRLHPHAFRHTMATRMLETGSDLRDAQVALGHASPKTTSIYVTIRPARLRNALGRLDFDGVPVSSHVSGVRVDAPRTDGAWDAAAPGGINLSLPPSPVGV